MAKLQRSQIYKKVVSTLKKEPSTIHQVAMETGINWETVNKSVETLSTIGFITSEEINGKTYYSVSDMAPEIEEDTLLGIPITDAQRHKTLQLKKRIHERWNNPRKLYKTFLHKILVRVIKTAKIKDIPYGWYLFGECVMLQCDPQDYLNVRSIGTQYDKEIDSAIEYYSDCQNTNELMLRTYKDENNPVYLSKLKISDILMNRFTDDSVHDLRRELRKLTFSFRKNDENAQIMEFVDGFIVMSLRILTNMSTKQAEDVRPHLAEAFCAVWELVATYSLLVALERNGFFSKQEIQKYYHLRVEQLMPLTEAYLNHLQDFEPTLDVENNPFKALQGSGSQ